ncbi:MAG: hypothetical protein NWP52_05065 [Flavobacteriaceae bacterium]|jgi:hypothetical protein|nr:hypothetical protein [Flavobacteriaceae bacterium]MDP4755103.1 hypothetical protein [Flavobacteriaceae bacterium]MDP4971714.1 hypothetical protein [Flavobacteriaceae bacterium]MDP5113331.1 hypothetical protein [Flavobacteriaceae bacterium]
MIESLAVYLIFESILLLFPEALAEVESDFARSVWSVILGESADNSCAYNELHKNKKTVP